MCGGVVEGVVRGETAGGAEHNGGNAVIRNTGKHIGFHAIHRQAGLGNATCGIGIGSRYKFDLGALAEQQGVGGGYGAQCGVETIEGHPVFATGCAIQIHPPGSQTSIGVPGQGHTGKAAKAIRVRKIAAAHQLRKGLHWGGRAHITFING